MDFKTHGDIRLRSDDIIRYSFKFTPASSATANDGNIPYGTTVSSCDVSVYTEDGTAVTSIVSSDTLSDNTCILTMQYPDDFGDGRYVIKFVLTLSSGDTKSNYFTRLYSETILPL